MKRLPLAIAALFCLVSLFSGCDKGNDWDEYADWYVKNRDFYQSMVLRAENGTPFYTKLSPKWNPSSGVLIHYFNNRALTEGNLTPLETSTVTVKYKLSLYDGTGVDSSYNAVDSLATFPVNGLITGWQVALNDMHVGDSCEIVVPYTEGYGADISGSIMPFSTLVFQLKLVDIPNYQTPEN